MSCSVELSMKKNITSGPCVGSSAITATLPCVDPGGGGGGARGPDQPLNNHKNIGFPSNTGPDPLKITKLPSQHSMWADDGPL